MCLDFSFSGLSKHYILLLLLSLRFHILTAPLSDHIRRPTKTVERANFPQCIWNVCIEFVCLREILSRDRQARVRFTDVHTLL